MIAGPFQPPLAPQGAIVGSHKIIQHVNIVTSKAKAHLTNPVVVAAMYNHRASPRPREHYHTSC